jgi:hypothetical protein
MLVTMLVTNAAAPSDKTLVALKQCKMLMPKATNFKPSRSLGIEKAYFEVAHWKWVNWSAGVERVE